MDRRCFLFAFALASFVALPSRAALPPPLALPFNPSSDELCFRNADPELSQFGLLGQWGASHGICQGMAGVAAAFYNNARFEPAAPADERPHARSTIARVIRLSKSRCPSKVAIKGFTGLSDYCQAHRRDFLRAALGLNANIAVFDILPRIVSFLERQDKPLATNRDRRDLKRELGSIYRGLARGAPQLLMHYSHVVMVYGMHYEPNASGRIGRAVLHVYNSNDSTPDSPSDDWVYAFDDDGLPSRSNASIWNITPNRPRWECGL